MQKISAVIIAFNEEAYIEQCLKSVEVVADEIVVVDSFSNDRTKEICLAKGVRFIEHEFTGYRDQKNFALTQASHDYVLSLDADEALSPALEKSILEVKRDFKHDGYKFNRLNSYCGNWIRHTNLSPECKIRLFNRNKAKWGGLNIHETVILTDPKSVTRLKGNLLHWLYDSYEESVNKMNTYTTLLANEYYKQGLKSSSVRILVSPAWRFFHSYVLKAGFLDGYDGFVVSKLLATTCFIKYVKLRNLHLQAKHRIQLSQSKGYNQGGLRDNQSDLKEVERKSFLIGFDAKRAFYNYSGLGNYSRNLLTALSRQYPENSYFLFTPKSKNRYILVNDDRYRIIEPQGLIYKYISSIWRIRFMKNAIKSEKIQLFHGLSQELPFGIEKTGVKSIVTVHDLIFMRFPEFYNWIDAKIYYLKLSHACRVSDKVVAISNQTKSDLIRFLNIPPDKIKVIHQGCNPYFWNDYTKEFWLEVKTKYNLPDRYLLYVGTIEERKNLLGIIKALHLKNIEVPLVVVGRKADEYYKTVMNYISKNNLNNVSFPDRVKNLELPVIYQNAECFIYPSFFEGFGIPILEALVSRTPVITSKNGCFSEAAGPGSLYVDPNDVEKIGEAIQKVISSKQLRDEMIETGLKFANKFKDEVIANNYMNLYSSMLS
jgi:glycosyltransferase involved in cell wall biosynthesis